MIFKKEKDKPKIEYYTSIKETPLSVWITINEGDLTGIIKEGSIDQVKSEKEIVNAWYQLNDSYLALFGIDKGIKQDIDLRKRYAFAMAEYLITNDKVYQMEAKILKKDIEDFQSLTSDNKATFMDIIVQVEKYFGFTLDIDQTTVHKFYTYLKTMRVNEAKR